jgi:Ca2+/Na+ antiporter
MIMVTHRISSFYFMKAVDSMIHRHNIRLDVAAATFMAVGGSAPEIFINFYSSLMLQTDLGLGTILGSGAFNSMCLIGICGVAAKQELSLSWWPLVRDFFFYTLMLAWVSVIMFGAEAQWWEALILLLLYTTYIVFMYYNTEIERFVKKQLGLPFEDDNGTAGSASTRSYSIRRYSITSLKPYIPQQLNFTKGVLGLVSRNTFISSVERKNS